MRPKLLWLLAIVLILGLAVGGVGPGQVLAKVDGGAATRPAAPALAPSTPTCFTWDFINNTGQDVDGLEIHLKGIPAVTDSYTGVSNPFGAPTSSYDPGTDVLKLVFSGGTAFDGSLVQVGICAQQTALRLDTLQPAFFWTVGTTVAAPAPLFAGLDYAWIDATHLQVHLYNDSSVVLTAFSLAALTPDSALSLDDLNDGTAATLPFVSDQIGDPLDLAVGASSPTYVIDFDQGGARVPTGAPVVLEAVLTAQDDPGNTVHLLVQTAQPFQQDYLPLVQR